MPRVFFNLCIVFFVYDKLYFFTITLNIPHYILVRVMYN